MLTLNSASFSSDQGRLLENAVFLHLKRNGDEVFYFKGLKECDFITRSNNGTLAAFQVCHILNDDNMKRELSGLVEALDILKLDQGLIITSDQTDQFIVDGKEINVVPAWKWMS